ncbi:MAG: hypothetical protein HY805_00995 [Nitrospirae bacterium]|nr:hypothetical protein [Nitrospirota bacterium]
MKRYVWLLFLFIFATAIVGYGTEVPEHETYFVNTEIEFNKSTGIYEYTYTLVNPAWNKNLLRSLDIYIPKDHNRIELSWENLAYGENYSYYSSEANKDKVIAVGIDGPSGWTYGIGYDEEGKGFVGSGSLDDYEIPPGNSVRVLILTSYGLPGLRDAEILPAIDYDNLPEEYWENVELSKQLRDSLIHHTKTLGPTAPPLDFNPLSFLDYIIGMKHDLYLVEKL